MTKYYVDNAGAYIGGFDGANPPAGAVEVPTPPADARQVWSGNAWQAVELSPYDTATLNAALTEPGSVVRALGLVTFQEINKLRSQAGLAQYTMAQFVAALKANIR